MEGATAERHVREFSKTPLVKLLEAYDHALRNAVGGLFKIRNQADFQDAMQEARAGFIEAYREHRLVRGAAIWTNANFRIREKLRRLYDELLRGNKDPLRDALSLDYEYEDEDGEVSTLHDYTATPTPPDNDLLDELNAALTPDERQITAALILGVEQKTIAAAKDISEPAVSKRVKSIRNKASAVGYRLVRDGPRVSHKTRYIRAQENRRLLGLPPNLHLWTRIEAEWPNRLGGLFEPPKPPATGNCDCLYDARFEPIPEPLEHYNKPDLKKIPSGKVRGRPAGYVDRYVKHMGFDVASGKREWGHDRNNNVLSTFEERRREEEHRQEKPLGPDTDTPIDTPEKPKTEKPRRDGPRKPVRGTLCRLEPARVPRPSAHRAYPAGPARATAFHVTDVVLMQDPPSPLKFKNYPTEASTTVRPGVWMSEIDFGAERRAWIAEAAATKPSGSEVFTCSGEAGTRCWIRPVGRLSWLGAWLASCRPRAASLALVASFYSDGVSTLSSKRSGPLEWKITAHIGKVPARGGRPLGSSWKREGWSVEYQSDSAPNAPLDPRTTHPEANLEKARRIWLGIPEPPRPLPPLPPPNRAVPPLQAMRSLLPPGLFVDDIAAPKKRIRHQPEQTVRYFWNGALREARPRRY